MGRQAAQPPRRSIIAVQQATQGIAEGLVDQGCDAGLAAAGQAAPSGAAGATLVASPGVRSLARHRGQHRPRASHWADAPGSDSLARQASAASSTTPTTIRLHPAARCHENVSPKYRTPMVIVNTKPRLTRGWATLTSSRERTQIHSAALVP